MTTDWIRSIRPLIEELERYARWADVSLGMHLERGPSRDQVEAEGKILPLGHPPVVVLVQTRGRRMVYGHFRSEGWETSDKSSAHEVSLSAETLLREPLDVLGTMQHELVHLWNWERGIRDYSKGGRHNKAFQAAAESFGLHVEKDGTHGFSKTCFDDAARAMIEDGFQPNKAVFDMARRVMPKQTTAKTKMIKWTCRCEPKPTIVRCATELLAICETCREPFEKQD